MSERAKIGKIIHQLENAFLVVIAILTVIGAGMEIRAIALKQEIGLQDLLLMFLYVEVLAMVGAYYDSKQIPISLPIFIAITALSRLAILQKEENPLHHVYEAAAILILAIASVVVNMRPSAKWLETSRDTEGAALLRPHASDEEREIKL